MPSSDARRPLGVECWVAGTRAELDSVVALLRQGLTVIQTVGPIPIGRGRHRLYVRGHHQLAVGQQDTPKPLPDPSPTTTPMPGGLF